MSVYEQLDVIDEFECKFGNRETVKRACDLMVSYLAETTRPLPELAAQGLRVGIRHKNGLGSVAELLAERKAISRFLQAHSARTNYDNPEYCAVHAVDGILAGYSDLSWGGGASELVSNFFDMIQKLDCDQDRLLQLLNGHFR